MYNKILIKTPMYNGQSKKGKPNTTFIHKLFGTLGLPAGLEVNFLEHLQSFASAIFFSLAPGEITSKFFPYVWETWMILSHKRLQVDIFCIGRLLKSLAFFCMFTSFNFEPWPVSENSEWQGDCYVIQAGTQTNLTHYVYVKTLKYTFSG